MVEFEYLRQGICGLAHAHLAGTMAGHLGAAVVAGYFCGEDLSGLPDEVYRGIEGECDRVIAGEEAIWFNAMSVGVTPTELFNPLPDGESDEESIGRIAEALRGNISETRQSGHNVIFAAIAIRALHDHPEFATAETIEGVRKLIAGFDGAHAGRGYYGEATGWKTGNQVQLEPDESFPPYDSLEQMVQITIGELIATASIKKQGFGGLWHIINHTAALVELDRYGYSELAREGLPAQHHHLRLWRSLPDVESELGAVAKADHDPREPAYWAGMLKRDEARLTHRIKTLYGYYILRPSLAEDLQATADDAFLYLMA